MARIDRLQAVWNKASVASSTLSDALVTHDISLAGGQCVKVDAYCKLLWEWNQRLNLTRHVDYDTFVARDVVDSMQLAEFLVEGETVLDIGSGGGVPGMLLAILRPDVSMTLCDAVKKKTNALADMVSKLELPVAVVNARVQDLLEFQRFDTLTARAVGPMSKILRWIAPHWDSTGRLLLIKGPRWGDERKEIRHQGLMRSLELRRLKSYPMSSTDSESVILSIVPSAKT